MLSKYEIEQLKKGSFGVLRDGTKVKYLGELTNSKFAWAQYDEQDKISLVVADYDDFQFYIGSASISQRDVIGLWGDKYEPFDLERALAGEPVLLANNKKAYILKHVEGALIGHYDTHSPYLWHFTGRATNHDFNIIGMWKEPEPVNQSADDLPKPIRKFGDLEKIWYVNKTNRGYEPSATSKVHGWTAFQYESLRKNCYYATKEDCQAVCNWLMNR